MNSFFIPALAGQIYAMPGMETQLHAVINKPGDYTGFSANYSGAGFPDMHFQFAGMSSNDFDAWIAKLKASDESLDAAAYKQLAKPSTREPVHHYRSEEHTSELQSLMRISYAVFCLKKKKHEHTPHY